MKDLYNALTERADKSGEIPILPPQSAQPTDPQQYVLVELLTGPFLAVTQALNASTTYISGYRPGVESRSYIFSHVTGDVRDALFLNTKRVSLPFRGRYEALERVAGVGDRKEILLGIGQLGQYSSDLGYMNPFTNSNLVAKALIGCLQMVTEAVRLRNIQQQILALADPRADGSYGVFHPDDLMVEYENKWEEISKAIQSAIHGILQQFA
ncbi:ribosome-inactivating protein SNAI'-like [Hibiscus syriacus]|uniref:ribosome-inactivating protein SNAI'-like n=1 Tax=Hibiscus syriacus TaxID=106335 RepID=UPI001923D2DC|nr:ribosome-inactivating protein SNAI'-like [Hibiscus syriacus]